MSDKSIFSRLSLPCTVCKSGPLEKISYVNHILGKRHQKNMKNRSRSLKKDEISRMIHVTGFNANTSIESIVGTFYNYEVLSITSTSNYCFVELRSRENVKKCLDKPHYIGDQKLKVKLRNQTQATGSSLPIKITKHTQNLLKRITTDAQTQWKAIEMLISDIELKVDHYQKREILRQTIENFFRPHFPAASACVFGSSANNLGFVGCDVDLYIHLGVDPWSCGSKAQKEKKAKDLTWYLASKLKNSRKGYKVQAIAKARVPIVKFEDALTGLHVDLSFRNSMPIYNTQLIYQYTRTHQLVRPYLMVIRYWAKIQDITGGGQPSYLITNYGFTMLMLYYLMVRDDPLIPTVSQLKSQCHMNIRRKHTIEGWDCSFGQDIAEWLEKRHNVTVLELVCEFFKYFGKFDHTKWVISPLTGQLLDKEAIKEKALEALPSCMECYCNQETDIQLDTALCLQDPIDLSYNITRGLNLGPLIEFQYKCRKAAETCDEIIKNKRPLGDLFEDILIDEEILSSIQNYNPPNTREVDITQEEIISVDDSVEMFQDKIEDLDIQMIENLGVTSLSNVGSPVENGRMKNSIADDKTKEVIEVCNVNNLSVKEIERDNDLNNYSKHISVNVGNENRMSGNSGLNHPSAKLPEATPEKKLFKIDLNFRNSREFSITFDGCISGGKDNMESPDQIGLAASSLIHFILQQCLKMEVSPLDWHAEDVKRKSECPDSTCSGKRMKNVNGNYVSIVPKYQKISEYRCSTTIQLWVGRKKASKTIPNKVNMNPLQVEMAITKAQLCDYFIPKNNIVSSKSLECVITVWQMIESPSRVLVTGDSLSSEKITKSIMVPFFTYLSSLAPNLLERISTYTSVNR